MTDAQLARALNALMKEVSIEVGEMIGLCMGEMDKATLSTDARCRKLERSIEEHRDVARSERRPFAVATAEGLLEAIRPVRLSLRGTGAGGSRNGNGARNGKHRRAA